MHLSVPNFLIPTYIQQLTEESLSFIQKLHPKAFNRLEIHLKLIYAAIQVSPLHTGTSHIQAGCLRTHHITKGYKTQHDQSLQVYLSLYLAPVFHSS